MLPGDFFGGAACIRLSGTRRVLVENYALLGLLKSKPGKEHEFEQFLKSALPGHAVAAGTLRNVQQKECGAN